MRFRTVRVEWAFEGKMRVRDEIGEIDELIEPDEFLREAVGSRMLGRVFKAVRNVNNVTGWEFKPYRGRPIYW